jgi:hypothetical protein
MQVFLVLVLTCQQQPSHHHHHLLGNDFCYFLLTCDLIGILMMHKCITWKPSILLFMNYHGLPTVPFLSFPNLLFLSKFFVTHF